MDFKNHTHVSWLFIRYLNSILFISRFNFPHNNSLSTNFAFYIIKMNLSFCSCGDVLHEQLIIHPTLMFLTAYFCMDKIFSYTSTSLSLFVQSLASSFSCSKSSFILFFLLYIWMFSLLILFITSFVYFI